MEVKTREPGVWQPIEESEQLGIELLELFSQFKQILDSLDVREYHRVLKVIPAIRDKFLEIKRKLTEAKAALREEPDSREKTKIRQGITDIIERIERVLMGLKNLQKAAEKFIT